MQPLGVISLGGSLPLALAKTLQASGVNFHCLCIEGLTDPQLLTFPHSVMRFLKVGEAIAALKAAHCKRIVFVGQFFRPNLFAMRFDLKTLRYLPLIMLSRRGGDDTVLKKVSKAFEKEGFEVVSLNDIAPALVAQLGRIGEHVFSSQNEVDAMKGLKALHALGAYDIGQALVIDHERVIAVEAAEGTDNMLARVQKLRGTERYQAPARSGVLVKAAKPQQHLRDDMPVIGLDTLRHAAAAGLEAVAVESGRVITADLPEMIKFANEHKIAVVGITGSGHA